MQWRMFGFRRLYFLSFQWYDDEGVLRQVSLGSFRLCHFLLYEYLYKFLYEFLYLYSTRTLPRRVGWDGVWFNSLRCAGTGLTPEQTSRLEIGEAWWAYTSEVERWSRFLKDCEIPFKGFFRSICTAAELAKLRDASRKVRIVRGSIMLS
jgi:hypothetical protein